MTYLRALLITALLASAQLISQAGFAGNDDIKRPPVPPAQTETLKLATFAGGCFWCMEKPFDHVDGVTKTVSGYIGGHLEKPTYADVSAGISGHREALQITYEPEKVTYKELLDVFWHNVDPLNARGQFCDNGTQYTTAIFYHDEAQKTAAEASKTSLEKSGRFKKDIVTAIEEAGVFYPAEEYHQDYYKKNPIRYKFYRYNCGRDKRLEELWGSE